MQKNLLLLPLNSGIEIQLEQFFYKFLFSYFWSFYF